MNHQWIPNLAGVCPKVTKCVCRARAPICRIQRLIGLISRIMQPAATQSFQQVQRCSCVAAFQNDEIENRAFIINSAPPEHMLSANLADHLIEMPARRRRRLATTETGGDLRTELCCPGAERLAGSIEAELDEQLLYIAHGLRKMEVEPHSVLDEHRREAMPPPMEFLQK